jgi:predicted GNAT family N-acyltransferase
MMKNNLRIRIVDNPDDMDISYKLRDTVFTKEQYVPAELDDDGKDDISTHLLLFENDIPIGNARILPDNKTAIIGRFCVLKEHRKNGAGMFLMEEVIKYCKKHCFEKIYLGSQVQAMGFYNKLGFKICGERYMDANIPHIEMQIII